MEQHYHREIAELSTKMATLGGMVDENIGRAMAALRDGNQALAREVISNEEAIDLKEVEIEEDCLRILALYQPVAKDLRFLVTVIKVVGELEGMGDLSEKIGRRVDEVTASQISETKMDLFLMGDKTRNMLRLALEALIEREPETARRVLSLDNEVDHLHEIHHRIIAKEVTSKEEEVTLAELKLLSVSRALERIADMATTIAEDVIYLVEGRIVRHSHQF